MSRNASRREIFLIVVPCGEIRCKTSTKQGVGHVFQTGGDGVENLICDRIDGAVISNRNVVVAFLGILPKDPRILVELGQTEAIRGVAQVDGAFYHNQQITIGIDMPIVKVDW